MGPSPGARRGWPDHVARRRLGLLQWGRARGLGGARCGAKTYEGGMPRFNGAEPGGSEGRAGQPPGEGVVPGRFNGAEPGGSEGPRPSSATIRFCALLQWGRAWGFGGASDPRARLVRRRSASMGPSPGARRGVVVGGAGGVDRLLQWGRARGLGGAPLLLPLTAPIACFNGAEPGGSEGRNESWPYLSNDSGASMGPSPGARRGPWAVRPRPSVRHASMGPSPGARRGYASAMAARSSPPRFNGAEPGGSEGRCRGGATHWGRTSFNGAEPGGSEGRAC